MEGTIPKMCLVVGGSGFIGSHLVESLLEKLISVRVFDRDYLRYQSYLGDRQGVELCVGDVTNQSEVEKALQGIDAVVYLVHSTVPATSMGDLAFDLESNIVPLIRFLDILKRRKRIKHFLYLSSGGTVYGNPKKRIPISETHPTQPISGYGLTKMIAEHYIRLLLTDTSVNTTVVRGSNVYGPRQNLAHPQGVVGIFLKNLCTNKPITIYGDGSVLRDFLYVTDLIRAMMMCLTNYNVLSDKMCIFNAGSGQGTSLLELVHIIERVTGRTFIIKRESDRHFDCRYNVLDSSLIHNALGWVPRIKLEDGIRWTWNWIKEEYSDE